MKKQQKTNKKKSILIVEDDQILNKILYDALAEKGYETFRAFDGKEGLDIALKKKPTLILLDLLMPIMDGNTMLKKLRQDKWGKDAFVIILTNLEPSADIIDEANQTPYKSMYFMKSEYDLNEITDTINEKIKELK